MDRLWLAACWRKPWRGAPRLVLPENCTLGLEAVAEVAEKFGMKLMARLPPEIVQMIRSFCDDSLFWKLASALDLSDRFHATSTSHITTLPLGKIVEWQRYSELVTADSRDSDSPDLPPFIRITIDSRGVSNIDRLDTDLSDDVMPRDNESYIIQDAASCDNIETILKVYLTFPYMEGHLLTIETGRPAALESARVSKGIEDMEHTGAIPAYRWPARRYRGLANARLRTTRLVVYSR